VHRRLGVSHFVVVLRQSSDAQRNRSHLSSVHVSLATRRLHDDSAARAQLNHSRPAPEEGLRCGGADELPICPRGFYCPDTITMKPCEEGFFCREGSKEPRACPVLTTCGPRTSAPTNNSDRPRRVHRRDMCLSIALSTLIWPPESSPSTHARAREKAAAEANSPAKRKSDPVIADPFASPDVPLERMGTLEEKIGLDRYQTIPAAVMESLMHGDESAGPKTGQEEEQVKAGGAATARSACSARLTSARRRRRSSRTRASTTPTTTSSSRSTASRSRPTSTSCRCTSAARRC
jgi:hypothetical protein